MGGWVRALPVRLVTVYGVDLSDFDYGRGPVDVAAMAHDGIQFVTAKATEGTGIRHLHFGETMTRARAAGIEFVGAYVVPRTPGNGGHGRVADQVAYLLDYVTAEVPWWRDWPGWMWQVDLEHWGYDDVAPEHGVEACRLLREQTGRQVILYAPRWAYGDTIGGDDPLWSSNYSQNPVLPYRQAYPGDSSGRWVAYSGRTPAILQFGSRTVIGRQSGCDANAFRGSIDEFRQFIQGQGGFVALSDEDQANMLAAITRLDGWAAGGKKPAPYGYEDGGAFGSLHLTLSAEDRDYIAARVLDNMPKPPTAAEVAAELIRQLTGQ